MSQSGDSHNFKNIVGSSKPSKKAVESEDSAQARMRALRKKLDAEAAERRKREEMSKNREQAIPWGQLGSYTARSAISCQIFFRLLGQSYKS